MHLASTSPASNLLLLFHLSFPCECARSLNNNDIGPDGARAFKEMFAVNNALTELEGYGRESSLHGSTFLAVLALRL